MKVQVAAGGHREDRDQQGPRDLPAQLEEDAGDPRAVAEALLEHPHGVRAEAGDGADGGDLEEGASGSQAPHAGAHERRRVRGVHDLPQHHGRGPGHFPRNPATMF